MISFDEAVDLVRSVARPLGAEVVPISKAVGRVLATPVIARIDSPRSDVSAMDGYAVRDEDLARLPAILHEVGGSFAGSRWEGSVEPGTCVRIFTGAPVPRCADRVVIQEEVRLSGDRAILDQHPGSIRYIRKRASDFAAGDVLLGAGRLVDPRAIVAAAAADVAELEVHRRPLLTILSTGDELAEPGTAREREDMIPESVSLGVCALASQWGAKWAGRMRLGDDLSAMSEAANTAIEQSDLVVVTGGASVGEKDFAKAMFEPLGLELLFSKLAIRPGKPAWLGGARGRIVMGLPGNPTSALVTARLLLAPLLAGMTGRPVERALGWRTLPLAAPIEACDARETFHRAQLVQGAARVLSFEDSSAQKVLADADLLVRQRAHAPALATGEPVETLDF
ncbi:MAG TPA: molybdopterin molybdotransferase MoeA [Sphingomicrobium sp.]|nr:molybdopterin molybdotransferase MoeA [Sphingomicrobium sp.]